MKSATPAAVVPRPLPDRTLQRIRRAFPVLKRVTYLNSGTYGPMPVPALRAYLSAMSELERDGVACARPLAAEAEELRAALARLIGAQPGEVAFTGNSTDGLNIVLAGTDWRAGDEVITTDEEHEALLHPLLYLQRTRSIRVHRVSVTHEPEAMLARLDGVRSGRTRLLAFSHVTCESGARLPVAEMCAWARRYGIRTLVDVAQSLGATSVDVTTIGCDYMAANGHKWLHGPTGTGFVYIRADRIEEIRPAHVGAGSLERADAASGLAEPWSTASRFEFGTRSWARAAGWLASLRWLERIGQNRVVAHMLAMGDQAIAMLRDCEGAELLTPTAPGGRAGLVTVSFRDHNAGAIGERLSRDHGIVTRHVPHYNALRFSMSHFTSAEDIAHLGAGLRHALGGQASTY